MDDDDIIDSTHPQRYNSSTSLQTLHCSWDESYYAATESLSSCALLCLYSNVGSYENNDNDDGDDYGDDYDHIYSNDEDHVDSNDDHDHGSTTIIIIMNRWIEQRWKVHTRLRGIISGYNLDCITRRNTVLLLIKWHRLRTYRIQRATKKVLLL